MSLKHFKIDKFVTTDIHHDIDGEAMAQLFWEMDEHEMAAFFNALGFNLRDIGYLFDRQMYAVATNKNLDEHGVQAITQISNMLAIRLEGDHG